MGRVRRYVLPRRAPPHHTRPGHCARKIEHVRRSIQHVAPSRDIWTPEREVPGEANRQRDRARLVEGVRLIEPGLLQLSADGTGETDTLDVD